MDILIADDSSAIQKVVRIAFKDTIFQTADVDSVDFLSARLRMLSPAAVLVNPKLPGLKGPLELKQIVDNIPVVLLVGTYDYIDVDEWSKAGFSHMMKKPFDGKALVRLVSSLIGMEKPDPNSKQGSQSDRKGVFQGLEMSLLAGGHFEESASTRASPHLNQSEDRGKKAFSELELSSLNFPDLSMGQGKPKAPSAPSIEDARVLSLPDLPHQKANPRGIEGDRSSMVNELGKKIDPLNSAPALSGSQAFGSDFSTDSRISPSSNYLSQGTSGRGGEKLDSNTLGVNSLGKLGSEDLLESGIKRRIDDLLTSSQSITPPFQLENLIANIWPRLQDLIRIEVRQYLDGQIKSQIPQMAKDVITGEIRRLTDEKARIHIDR